MHYIYIIFKIFKLQFHLERANAEEFHEVYKGVVNEYKVGTNVRIMNNLPEINISIFQQIFVKKFKKKFQQILTLCSLTVQTLIHFHLSFVGHVSTQQNEAFVVGYFNILGLLQCQYFLYRICFKICFIFQSMVDELCCGQCIAMEIRAPDAPVSFREFVGPSDPVS